MGECVFCDIINGKIQCEIIYQDEVLICFLDYDPINAGHLLIVPKRHVLDLDELNEIELSHIMLKTKEMLVLLKQTFKMDGYSVMQNGGAFNDIGHFHLHLFPRYKNDGFEWIYREGNQVDLKEVSHLLKNKINQ